MLAVPGTQLILRDSGTAGLGQLSGSLTISLPERDSTHDLPNEKEKSINYLLSVVSTCFCGITSSYITFHYLIKISKKRAVHFALDLLLLSLNS